MYNDSYWDQNFCTYMEVFILHPVFRGLVKRGSTVLKLTADPDVTLFASFNPLTVKITI